MALINKINVGDTTYDLGASLLYGVCETAKATAAKAVTVTGNFTLETGATIAVKFTNTNTASSPTLNVNGTGAKAIKRYGTTAIGTSTYTSWAAGQVVIFVYDGTQWQRTFNEATAGDITGVTAGTGLTGGGSSGAVTLNVGAGTGIAVADDTVSVKLQDTTALTNEATAVSSLGSVNTRPIQIDSEGNLSVRVNDGYVSGGSAPIALIGKLYSETDEKIISDINLASEVQISGTRGERGGYLLRNAQIHPDAREFCFVNITFTPNNSTMVGTGTIQGLTNYYPGLTIAAYLSGDFSYTNSITLNLNSLGAKNVTGLNKSIIAGNIVLLTYTQGGDWRVAKAQASPDEKVKQYNIKVEDNLANGEVAWSGYFPLLTLYNRDSSTFTGETAYTSGYYLDPITNGLVAQKIKTDSLNAPVVTTSFKGLMSSDDKIKLDSLNGPYAPLDENNIIPTAYLPSYVDDVLEYSAKSSFPTTGETGKIYVDTSTNKTYRWGGSTYVEISSSLALGETSSTAYRGDRGKIAYNHSQSTHAPTNAEKNQNAFSNVKVGSTTVAADTTTDTIELVAGSNITLTPDATNDKITIAATNTDTKVKQTICSTDANYPLLFKYTSGVDSTAEKTEQTYFNNGIYINPYDQALYLDDGDGYFSALTPYTFEIKEDTGDYYGVNLTPTSISFDNGTDRQFSIFYGAPNGTEEVKNAWKDWLGIDTIENQLSTLVDANEVEY